MKLYNDACRWAYTSRLAGLILIVSVAFAAVGVLRGLPDLSPHMWLDFTKLGLGLMVLGTRIHFARQPYCPACGATVKTCWGQYCQW